MAILFKVLIARKSVDCPSVSLHDVFLYDAPLKLTFSDPVLSGQFLKSWTSYFTDTYMQYLFICLLYNQKIIAFLIGHWRLHK